MWRKTLVFASFMCLSGQGRRAEGELGQGSGVCVPPVIARTIGGELAAFLYYFFCLLGYVGGHFGVILGPSGAILEARKPKWLAKGVLERPWGALGALWRSSGSHLGPSWAPFGAILGHLGAVRGRLGAVLGPSWAVLGPSWAVLGPPWGSRRAFGSHRGALRGNRKNHTKTIGFSMILASRGSSCGVLGVCWAVLEASWAILEASWRPSWAIWSHLGGHEPT